MVRAKSGQIGLCKRFREASVAVGRPFPLSGRVLIGARVKTRRSIGVVGRGRVALLRRIFDRSNFCAVRKRESSLYDRACYAG